MRPAILSAKQTRQSKIISDADRLKAMDKANRPGEASLDAVRDAYADAMDELCDCSGSVAAVEAVALPSDRLGG